MRTALLAFCLLIPGLALSDGGQLGGFKAGIELRETAGAKELGLPLYPRSEPQRESGEDKGMVSLGLWGGAFGVRLAVAKFKTGADLAAVALYYRREMAAYGAVLECRPENSGPAKAKSEPGRLSCADAEPGPGGLVLKVGRPKDQRVVALQPKGKELWFQLVRIEARGD